MMNRLGSGVQRPAVGGSPWLQDRSAWRPLPTRSMVGQLPLEQHIGVRIPGGQPIIFKGGQQCCIVPIPAFCYYSSRDGPRFPKPLLLLPVEHHRRVYQLVSDFQAQLIQKTHPQLNSRVCLIFVPVFSLYFTQ